MTRHCIMQELSRLHGGKITLDVYIQLKYFFYFDSKKSNIYLHHVFHLKLLSNTSLDINTKEITLKTFFEYLRCYGSLQLEVKITTKYGNMNDQQKGNIH